jgi:hypothetical protein
MLMLPAEIQQTLKEKAASSGLTLEIFLERLAEREARTSLAGANGLGSSLSMDQWIDELRKWAESHRRLDWLADDSRESIYEDREA